MAPSTRRSSARNAQALDNKPPSTIPAKRSRGRPPRNSINVADDSPSSAPTPTTSLSGSEYSTPATSLAVTPAPSTAKPASSVRTRTRSTLTIELPDRIADSEDIVAKRRTIPNNVKRPRPAARSSIANSDDDDDDLGYDSNDHDAMLARQLQAEEDQKTAAALAAPKPSSSHQPLRRSTRGSRVEPTVVDDSENNSDSIKDEESEVANSDDDFTSPAPPSTNGKGKGKDKGKGKAVARSTNGKPMSARGRAKVENSDSEEEPLSNSAPARKKQRTGKSNRSVKESEDEDQTDFATEESSDLDDSDIEPPELPHRRSSAPRRQPRKGRTARMREKLESFHPELRTMWKDLKNMPVLNEGRAPQPENISRRLKPFQLEGLAWMKGMERDEWKGGLLGDEMGLGKTIQAVSLIMSDYPAPAPSLVLVPPVALMQWTAEIDSYTGGRLKTLVFHGTNSKAKNADLAELKGYDVIMMSYNSLESMYRKQEKGFARRDGIVKEKSLVHKIDFHRVILDEAHCIKTRTTMTAKACFALKVNYRWCLSGTPLQNRIGEFFSLIRFLNIQPFSSYFCKECPCQGLTWSMDDHGKCTRCKHHSMGHISVFNQELLNPIQKYGNRGEGAEAFKKLRMLTDRIMLRRQKKDHTDSMELPVKEIFVDRQFFGEEENDFASSIMTNTRRTFNTYVAEGVVLNNYANIFGLIMQMRQVADHPDLILKKSSEGGQNILVCCICDEPAEEAIRSRCKHDFCRVCATNYVNSQDQPDCPHCHIPLSIDLEQPEIEQDDALVKKSSIINRIKMENWTSSSKIELLVHELHKLRSNNASHKSIIFSQFTTMLQLIEWRLRRAGITTVMLDGSMSPAQRQASINHFMTNADVECFLISLKAGGVALNLTEASRVFIVDPWWNPAAEWQSADRCHRIGQARPCTITRLCIEDSVESRMVLLQEKKSNMIKSTINSDDTAMESLSAEDLQFLFRGG